MAAAMIFVSEKTIKMATYDKVDLGLIISGGNAFPAFNCLAELLKEIVSSLILCMTYLRSGYLRNA